MEVESAQSETKRARVAHRDYSSFSSAITKMMRQRASVSSKAMRTLDGITKDLTTKLTAEASKFAEMDRRTTVKPRDIQAATKLLVRGELGVKAVAACEGPLSKVTAMHNTKMLARKARKAASGQA